ncbi:S24 family peptidase, partial [Campylobacter gastrosuis]|uniref:S24 family peptidase n=1 Tax=Campylobacter gastrosuis TaxID=2974576 RepID=UPI0032C22A39
IKKYEAGSVENFTYENLKKISSAFNVTPSDFLDEFLSANVSDNHKKNVRQCVSQSQNLSVNVSPNPISLKKSQLEQIKNDQIYIRELSSKVGAGESVDVDGIEIYDTDILVPFSAKLFKVRPQNTNNIRCMRVDGYSMIPMLYPDSWVIADVTARFSGDGLYIINFCGSFMVKLLQKAPNGTLYIKSVNKDYQSYEIGPDDQTEVYIVGKVLRCVI